MQATAIAERVAAELDRKIEAYINSVDPPAADFDRLALELFEYQYENNAPYRRLCDQHGLTPSTVESWRAMPALAAASFGDARIASFPADRTMLTFLSSGTTRRGGKSVHELENALLYDASLLAHFRRCVLPDLDGIRMVLLSPSFEQSPQSSLAYMLSKVYERFATGGGFFIENDALNVEGVVKALNAAQDPLLIFGTAFAFVHFLDHCTKLGLHFVLPPGSRVVETGGFKGKSRTLQRDELYASFVHTFGVAREFCIAEYGMCELGSQWYDAALSDTLAGRPAREQIKIGPHWTRMLVVDPITGQPVSQGATGLLQVVDLSNRGSVATVLTGDLVFERDGGFVYVGRSQAAPPKGCSITVDALLRRLD